MDDYENEMDELDQQVGQLEEVGAITEVGAQKLRKMLRRGRSGAVGGPLPSPPFGRSKRDTERRAPLGFKEDGTGNRFFTLLGVIGATTTMEGKVSRVAHPNRLLIVPSGPGAIIQSIKVGDEEQVLAAGAPVELYSTVALNDTIPDDFSPISSALDFVIVLENTTVVAITGTIGLKAAVKR